MTKACKSIYFELGFENSHPGYVDHSFASIYTNVRWHCRRDLRLPHLHNNEDQTIITNQLTIVDSPPPCCRNWDSWFSCAPTSPTGRAYSFLRRRVAECREGPRGGTSGGAGSGGDSSFTSAGEKLRFRYKKLVPEVVHKNYSDTDVTTPFNFETLQIGTNKKWYKENIKLIECRLSRLLPIVQMSCGYCRVLVVMFVARWSCCQLL